MKYTKTIKTEVDAIQFNGTWDGLSEIIGKFPDLEQDGMFLNEDKVTVPWFGIKTKDGTVRCVPSDYVVRCINGLFMSFPAGPFEALYIKQGGNVRSHRDMSDEDLLKVGEIIGGLSNVSNESNINYIKSHICTNKFYNAVTNIPGYKWYEAFEYIKSKGYTIE